MKNFTNILRLLAFLVIGTSATAVWGQPLNNDCPGALGMTMNPNGSCAATTAVVTTGATISAPVIVSGAFCANTSGTDDVWYTFSTNVGQTGTILTVSNIVATLGTVTSIGYAVYSGPCTGLTQLVCIASGITTTSTISGLTASTTYFLRTWAGGGSNSATFTLCLQESPSVPPNCATGLMPASGTAPLLCPNPTTSPSTVVFTWTAPGSGPAPTGYKFYLAITPAPPALLGTVPSTTASIFNLLPSTSYNWYVVPTNGADAVGCNTPLTFTTDVEPACVVNNTCATATMVGMVGNDGTVNSTTTGASTSRVAEACAGFTGIADDDVWFSFTTDGDGGDVTVAVTAAATALDPVIIVYSGTCGALVNIGCADLTISGVSPANDETAIVTGLAPSTTYYVRVYGYGQFNNTTPTSGAFTLTTSGTGVAGALPLELKSFTGQVQASKNLLNWETLTEKNVKSHLVERSIDGARWSEVGTVAGKGDSQVSVKYSLEDRAPLAKAYYRLRSVDFDGKENLSGSIVLTRKGESFGITSVYPSPTTSNVTVQFNSTSEEKVTVRVLDMTGRLVMEQYTEAVKDINELPIILTGLQAGVYSVTVSNSTDVSAPVRFVKH